MVIESESIRKLTCDYISTLKVSIVLLPKFPMKIRFNNIIRLLGSLRIIKGQPPTTSHRQTCVRTMALTPKLAGEFVVKNAKHLKVNPEGIAKLCKDVIAGIQSKEIDIENFSQHQYHPNASDANALNWIFVIDTLNFCFWTPGCDTKWQVNGQTGYFALCAAIKRALDEGVNISSPAMYSEISEEKLAHILRGDDPSTQCPLLAQRVECLHEVGKKLIEKYDGDFKNCVVKCKNSAMLLLDLIVSEFPCFRDEAVFHGQRVAIYKRAQILVGDIWACYRGEGLGHFTDIQKISMFADYRVPQVLVHYGAMEYSTELLQILNTGILLKNGCEQEVEIRAGSIYVVEQLKEMVLNELKAKHPEIPTTKVNSILLDHFLWDYRRKHAAALEYIPFHKTLSVYY